MAWRDGNELLDLLKGPAAIDLSCVEQDGLVSSDWVGGRVAADEGSADRYAAEKATVKGSERPTPNVQRPTSKGELMVPKLGVGCWALDVGRCDHELISCL